MTELNELYKHIEQLYQAATPGTLESIGYRNALLDVQFWITSKLITKSLHNATL